MDPILFLTALAVAWWALKRRYDHERIALLAQHLRNTQIEPHMEALIDGYLRALGESDAERRDAVWGLLATRETALVSQFDDFARGFAAVGVVPARVHKGAISLPYADRVFPVPTFDMRDLLALHARGIRAAVANDDGLPAKARAHRITAELLLMQHSCHWYCRSQAVASARLLRRHQTAHAQALAAVAPATREGYVALTGVRLPTA